MAVNPSIDTADELATSGANNERIISSDMNILPSSPACHSINNTTQISDASGNSISSIVNQHLFSPEPMSLENTSLSPSALRLDEVGNGINGFASSQDAGHSRLQTPNSQSADETGGMTSCIEKDLCMKLLPTNLDTEHLQVWLFNARTVLRYFGLDATELSCVSQPFSRPGEAMASASLAVLRTLARRYKNCGVAVIEALKNLADESREETERKTRTRQDGETRKNYVEVSVEILRKARTLFVEMKATFKEGNFDQGIWFQEGMPKPESIEVHESRKKRHCISKFKQRMIESLACLDELDRPEYNFEKVDEGLRKILEKNQSMIEKMINLNIKDDYSEGPRSKENDVDTESQDCDAESELADMEGLDEASVDNLDHDSGEFAYQDTELEGEEEEDDSLTGDNDRNLDNEMVKAGEDDTHALEGDSGEDERAPKRFKI